MTDDRKSRSTSRRDARVSRTLVSLAGFFLVSALALASSEAATIRVHYDTGWGSYISIRGNAASLSWYSGNSATWTAGNVWIYQTPVSDGGFEFKPLVDDASWSVGSNYTVPSGNSVVDIYPFFRRPKRDAGHDR